MSTDKIKSIELILTKKPPVLDETKRDRLLTLPRMQRDSPPTYKSPGPALAIASTRSSPAPPRYVEKTRSP